MIPLIFWSSSGNSGEGGLFMCAPDREIPLYILSYIIKPEFDGKMAAKNELTGNKEYDELLAAYQNNEMSFAHFSKKAKEIQY